jgi:hypothetical protein
MYQIQSWTCTWLVHWLVWSRIVYPFKCHSLMHAYLMVTVAFGCPTPWACSDRHAGHRQRMSKSLYLLKWQNSNENIKWSVKASMLDRTISMIISNFLTKFYSNSIEQDKLVTILTTHNVDNVNSTLSNIFDFGKIFKFVSHYFKHVACINPGRTSPCRDHATMFFCILVSITRCIAPTRWESLGVARRRFEWIQVDSR